MPYYLVFDARGALIGSGFASDDLALPAGATSCTQDEFAMAPAVALHNGAIVPIPAVTVVPIALAPALVQSARDAILGGLTITSTGTPAINGVYPCQGPTWEYLKDEATFITTFGSFSTGTPSIVFTLPDGRAVQFASTALMLAVVKAIGMYLTSLAIIEAANAGVLPAASVTIA